MAKRMFQSYNAGRTARVEAQAQKNIDAAQAAGILPTPKSKGRAAKPKAPVRRGSPTPAQNPNAPLETGGAFF